MMKKIILLVAGALILSNLGDLGCAEERKDASKRPKQILFEGRIIEVMDWDYWETFKRNYFGYGNMIGQIDFRMIFPDAPKEAKDKQKLRLLSYITTTAISGQRVEAGDIVPVTTYSIKDGKPFYEEKKIGTTFIFMSCLEPGSQIITTDLEMNYRYIAGWEKLKGISAKERPIIFDLSSQTAFMLKSGETIILGGGATAYNEIKGNKDRGRIFALITMKIQDVAQ